jgi:pyruvate-formate lyase-activating enzyme
MEREYMIRVTRHPLDKGQILALATRGELPPDHADRSVEATDFVKVTADSDAKAAALARRTTSLTVKGERTTVEEVMRGEVYRDLEPREVPV